MANQELQQSCSPCQSWADLRIGQWLEGKSFGRFWERFPHYWGDKKTWLLPFPWMFSISVWTFKLYSISGSWGEPGWNKTNTGQEQSQKNHRETNSEPDTLLLTFYYTKGFSSWLGKPIWVSFCSLHPKYPTWYIIDMGHFVSDQAYIFFFSPM